MVKYKTSFDNLHSHTWGPKKKRTSVDRGHSHPINKNKTMALKGKTNHTHRLLKKKIN